MLAFSRRTLRNRHIKEAQFRKVAAELQAGDIILLHTRFHALSWLIRFISKSYWNHVAIVLTTFEDLPGFHSVLVAEAAEDGIEIHRMQKFLDNGLYDFGVKRVAGLSKEDRDNLTGYILSNIDSPYDYRRLARNGYAFLTGDFKRFKNLVNDKSFLCSSFIQKAFYFSLPPEKRSQIIFLPPHDMERTSEFITPGDFAKTHNTEWIFNERY